VTPVRVGWVLALFATLCFSVAPPIARAAIVGGLNPTAILVVRMTITLGLLVLTVVLSNPALLRAERRTMSIAFGAGLINSLGMMGYFWALSLLDASIASMLFAVSPLFTLGVLALRGEPLTRRNVLRMVLALMGVYLLIGPGGTVNPVGVLLIGVSVVAFGMQVVLIQWYLRGNDARTITLYMTAGMWSGLSIFWLIQGMPWQPPGPVGWAAILILAIVSTYLARLAFFGAVSRLGGAQVAMLTPLEILLTVIWSVLFLGERLTMVQWLGGLLILASAGLAIHLPSQKTLGKR
jgi:drug/metabolite transporter (DMT)-like permease